MKTFLFSMFGILAVVAVGFVVKSQLDRSDSQATSAEAKNSDPLAASTSPTGGQGIPATQQAPAPVQAQAEERLETVWTSQSTRQEAVPANPSRATAGAAKQSANSVVPRNAQPSSPTALGSPAYSSAPSGFNSSKQASPSAIPEVSSATGPVTLELDPGVPVPAALIPDEGESQSPTVAAAQQQIADSFVEKVDNALAEPDTSAGNAAVNDAYYDSLARANELYRALYGDQAYNNKTMQATLEAKTGK